MSSCMSGDTRALVALRSAYINPVTGWTMQRDLLLPEAANTDQAPHKLDLHGTLEPWTCRLFSIATVQDGASSIVIKPVPPLT